MPRLTLGSPNPQQARCPQCGETLTLRRHRGLGGSREWGCPVAASERLYRARRAGGPLSEWSHRRQGAIHDGNWTFVEADLAALVEGRPSSWHLNRDRWLALDRGDRAEYHRLTAEVRRALSGKASIQAA